MRTLGAALAGALLAGLVVAVWPAVAPRGPESEYVVIDLGSFGGETEGRGLNNRDEVVGWGRDAAGRPVIFLWKDEVITRLKAPEGQKDVEVRDITDAGLIVGAVATGWIHSLVWADPANDPRDIGTIGGPTADTHGVSNLGHVVGNARRPGDMLWCPYVWDGEKMTAIATPNGGGGVAFGINDRDEVVGDYSSVPGGFDPPFRAFLWSDGVARDLGTLGGKEAVAVRINNASQVVGFAGTQEDKQRPFLWVDGKMTDLGTLGGGTGAAHGINADGAIVGESAVADGTNHAFLYRDGRMIDLNALVPPDSGWVLASAVDINDHGCIVGKGLHSGRPRGFILSLRRHPPLPLPPRPPAVFVKGDGRLPALGGL